MPWRPAAAAVLSNELRDTGINSFDMPGCGASSSSARRDRTSGMSTSVRPGTAIRFEISAKSWLSNLKCPLSHA